MPTTTVVNMFYIGNFADADTNESNNFTEDSASFVRAYSEATLVSVSEFDADDDGVISDDESNPNSETLSYDAGGGAAVEEIDSTNAVTVRVLLGDGTTTDVTAALLQMTNGDILLRDVGGSLDNLNIQSFEVIAVINNAYDGSMSSNSVENSRVVCFASGTRILTPRGEVVVETLACGDLVITADRAAQPIVWIGYSDQPASRKHAPIVIAAGALGAGLPRRSLRVSPQHRILIRSKTAQRMFGTPEVLVPAIRLVGQPGIVQDHAGRPVRYWHILLKEHHILRADGALTESFLPGPYALSCLSTRALRDVHKALGSKTAPSKVKPARLLPPRNKQKRLIWRICKNQKCLFDAGEIAPDVSRNNTATIIKGNFAAVLPEASNRMRLGHYP